MSSFYGGGGCSGGITSGEVNTKIAYAIEQLEEIIDHNIIVSETQPTVQQAGDIWVVVEDDQATNDNG